MSAPGAPDDTGGAGAQRLDKWLWFARVVKTRTMAQGLIVDGRVRVNRDRIDKPAFGLKRGDVLTISVHHRVRVLEVAGLGVRRGPPAEAAKLYVDLSPPPAPNRPAPTPEEQGAALRRDPGTGRPTKRDRRRIDKLLGGD